MYHLFVNVHEPYEGYQYDAMGSYRGPFESVEKAQEAVILAEYIEADICIIQDGRLLIFCVGYDGQWKEVSEQERQL